MAGDKNKAKKQKKASKTHFLSQGGKIDYTFLMLLLLILIFGLIMMFSASYADAYHRHHDSFHYITRQLFFAIAGLVVMSAVSMMDFRIIRNFRNVIMLVSIALLCLVFTQPDINHAHRWIFIADIVTFQPSEIAKFALIVYLADYITKNADRMKTFRYGIVKPLIMVAMLAILLIIEPHLSGMVIIVTIGVAMLFIGGSNIWHMVSMGIIGIPSVLLVIFAAGKWDRLMSRVTYWLHPETDPGKNGYQIIQSLYAIGSGGLMGVGIGNSRQKYLYLPEPQNDFIFSIICEEIGFVGAVLLLMIFAMFVWRGFSIALKCKDRFGSLLCAGITLQVGIQVIFNVCVVTGIFPNTGIPLPFFSFGGTALAVLLAEMGVILSISRENNMEDKE